MKLDWKILDFNSFSLLDLYSVLQLRSEVFVVEQDCVYQDLDGKDHKALHVIGFKEGRVVAYARIFNAGDYFDKSSIGRVVVAEEERKYGFGHELIKVSKQAIADNFNTSNIKLSAQTYLKNFYESHGFITVGEEYLEDGIPHIAMIIE